MNKLKIHEALNVYPQMVDHNIIGKLKLVEKAMDGEEAQASRRKLHEQRSKLMANSNSSLSHRLEQMKQSYLQQTELELKQLQQQFNQQIYMINNEYEEEKKQKKKIKAKMMKESALLGSASPQHAHRAAKARESTAILLREKVISQYSQQNLKKAGQVSKFGQQKPAPGESCHHAPEMEGIESGSQFELVAGTKSNLSQFHTLEDQGTDQESPLLHTQQKLHPSAAILGTNGNDAEGLPLRRTEQEDTYSDMRTSCKKKTVTFQDVDARAPESLRVVEVPVPKHEQELKEFIRVQIEAMNTVRRDQPVVVEYDNLIKLHNKIHSVRQEYQDKTLSKPKKKPLRLLQRRGNQSSFSQKNLLLLGSQTPSSASYGLLSPKEPLAYNSASHMEASLQGKSASVHLSHKSLHQSSGGPELLQQQQPQQQGPFSLHIKPMTGTSSNNGKVSTAMQSPQNQLLNFSRSANQSSMPASLTQIVSQRDANQKHSQFHRKIKSLLPRK